MASAVEFLRQRYRVTIDYEEPKCLCKGDIAVTPGSGRARLAGGILRLDIDGEHDSAAEALSLLAGPKLLSSTAAGMFALERVQPTVFHIVPNQVRSAYGYSLETVRSRLEKTVAVPVRGLNASDAAGRCVALALGVDSVSVDAAGDAVRSALQKPMRDDAKEIAGRAADVLDQILASAHVNGSWELLYDPASDCHRLLVSASREW